MALLLPVSSSQTGIPFVGISYKIFNPITKDSVYGYRKGLCCGRKSEKRTLLIRCSAPKHVKDNTLDKHVVKQNKIRFVQKLRTLLLSKPKHYISLHILSKCRSYLGLPKPRSLVSMIKRYPTIFELFYIPFPPTPLNATKTYSQLCVRLTPAAESLSMHEAQLQSANSLTLVNKLQKLLLLSSHRRLVLSKLAHLGPDLGLPPNFRSRLCNEYPERFKTVDTSYGRALELVSWDPNLANALPKIRSKTQEPIVDRPAKFKLLKLRKGLNVKRRHHDLLMQFADLPDICPYNTSAEEFPKRSLEAEKRACAVVREVLGMTAEKRTLVDHLTHFRKEFGLPNKVRGMMMRHPELFYVSYKGQRDSVFLVEAYDEFGQLLVKDESLVIKNRLLELVTVGKRRRREEKWTLYNDTLSDERPVAIIDPNIEPYDVDEEDGLEDLFEWEASDFEMSEEDSDEEYGSPLDGNGRKVFWSSDSNHTAPGKSVQSSEPW